MADTDRIPSYDDLMQELQDALSAIGRVERRLGAFETDAFGAPVREDVNEAVRALQRARDRVQQSLGS